MGYEYADVVVARNSLMPLDRANPAAGTFVKYTVCKRDSNAPYVIDYQALNELEGTSVEKDGWGGRPTIGGSPQGRSSNLTFEQVASCIRKL